jgi:hypothetical protein
MTKRLKGPTGVVIYFVSLRWQKGRRRGIKNDAEISLKNPAADAVKLGSASAPSS